MSSEAEHGADVDELPDAESCPYVIGESTYRKHARLETKPPDGNRSGGYERFRSYEDLPTDPPGKHDVYEYHHRLLALLHDDVVEKPIEGAIAYVGRREVHHKNGLKWDNRLENFELETKSDHSSITQQQRLAFAKDEQRRRDREETKPLGADSFCPGCDTETETPATSPAFDGERCIECAMSEADGARINL